MRSPARPENACWSSGARGAGKRRRRFVAAGRAGPMAAVSSLILTTLLLMAAAAHAERLIVAADDPTLQQSLVDLLSKTGVEVTARAVVTRGELSGARRSDGSEDEAARAHAHALAAAEAADVVAVVVPAASGERATLAVYDVRTNTLLVRAVPHRTPPSAEEAATTAGMVRVMMNAARHGSAPPEPPPQAAPDVSTAAAPREPADDGHRMTVGLELGAGLRAGIGPGTSRMGPPTVYENWLPELRVGVAAARAFWLLGVAASISTAGARDRSGPDQPFTGDVRHTTAGVLAGLRFALRKRLTLEPRVWVGAHRTQAVGESSGEPIATTRWDPAARLVGRLGVGLTRRLSLGCSLAAEGVWTVLPPGGPPGQRPDGAQESPTLDVQALGGVDLVLSLP